MPSLHELQTRVMDALLGDSSADAAPPVSLPPDRLAIYRNNVRANFLDSLHSSFPALWRLVGEDYFRQSARQFHRRHPSRSGDLLHVGATFPSFLAELHRGTEFSYLADVARLEWLVQEALLAAEHAPLNLTELARVEPSAYDTLRFELHPALRLFESPYPAVRIRAANVDSANEPPHIDLGEGGDRVAVMRRQLQLEFHRLSLGEYSFLEALGRGEAFDSAVAAGASEFDAGSTLRRFVEMEAIVDFRAI